MKSKNRAPAVSSADWQDVKTEIAPEDIRAAWKASTRAELEGIDARALARVGGLFRSYYREPSWRAFKREFINTAAGFHGVEYLGVDRRTGEHVYYCNAGDVYAATLCFSGGRLFIACIGDLVEYGRVSS